MPTTYLFQLNSSQIYRPLKRVADYRLFSPELISSFGGGQEAAEQTLITIVTISIGCLCRYPQRLAQPCSILERHSRTNDSFHAFVLRKYHLGQKDWR